MEAVRSAIELPTELKWKVRPGYSASSMPWADALLTVPSMVSTGALKWPWATWMVDSLVWRTCCWMRSYSARRSESYSARMKRAAFYMRVSTLDQHPETQLLDLRQMAARRG